MIGNQSHNHSVRVQDFSLDASQTANRILIFIRDTLPEFETIYKESNMEIPLEDDISKELFRFFNDQARSENLCFQFNEKKGVDFKIFVHPFSMGASSIFMIEAKRLSKSHYDYVSGRTGGIERFKREQDEFGDHLNYAAMIGYIQNEDELFWENKINSWIDDLIQKETDIVWGAKDKLIRDGQLSDFSSIHERVSKESIKLYHFWLSLN